MEELRWDEERISDWLPTGSAEPQQFIRDNPLISICGLMRKAPMSVV